jgi:hypothetical protein
MKFLSKFTYLLLIFSFFSLFITYYLLHTTVVRAQVPGLLIPCDETRENEFHTLRPYQASPCGQYPPQALFCSNKLIIFENFQLNKEHVCLELRRKQTGNFDCPVNYQVEEHDLNITLDESELPIMGNTEDEFDDATKLNEYASWYLSGVNRVGSTGETTDDRTVNLSGPLNKLLPQMVQEAVRVETIKKATSPTDVSIVDDNERPGVINTTEMHDQIAVCGNEFKLFGIVIGQTKPTECYSGNEKIRISEWSKDLSIFNGFFNNVFRTNAWNKRYPPLPWADENGQPFETQQAYQKAYREWRGESCANIPGIDLTLCIDNPFVPNKWATLYPYIPLASSDDSEGKNYLLTGDGPNYVPTPPTEIENAQNKDPKNAILYFSHMQEVASLSGLLNKTYWPQGYVSEKLPETTEKLKKGIAEASPKPNNTLASRDPYAELDCSAVNVRVNEGDNLFPGEKPSGKEIFVEKVKYLITNVECHEVYEPPTKFGCGPYEADPCPQVWTLDCPAQVGIEFKTGTKTPYADEIFSQTVADSGATFRKIFPKVEKGAPVECVADIPTVSNVTYSIDNPLHQSPPGGEQEFKQVVYPADGANSETQLTFPHIGSVYEYFLKGIQTALRPKGYGEPIANGNCKPSEPVECGEWEEKLEKSSGGDCGVCTSELGDLAKRILATAGKAYNVPAAVIWATMKHEGADGYQGTTYDFSDENVRKWSNSEECGGEPMPACDNSIQETQPPFGFLMNWFYNDAGNDTPWSSVQKIDPSRNSKDKVSRCNFLDAAFAAANVLSQTSAIYANGVMSCGTDTNGNPYTFDNTRPGTCSPSYWNDNHVAQSLTTYVGYCVDDDPNRLYTTQQAVGWFKDAKCN